MSGLERLGRLGVAAQGRVAEAAGTGVVARFLWEAVALEGQSPPEGDWRTWVFLGGRGAGKTRAGAEWLADQAERVGRLALVGPTLHDVREVMIGGESGLARLPRRAAPRYEPSRRRLLFDSGAVGYAFSAEDPDGLRGPQFGAAWADELAAWPRPGATLAILRMGLRLGAAPRLCVTTTPRPIPALRRLLGEPGCVRTGARTADNPWLSAAMRAHVTAVYGGTRVAEQELDGRLLEAEGALWRAEDLTRARGAAPEGPLERVVVAIDPAVTPDGDACGIVVAGRRGERAYVLEDLSARGLSPLGWARRAVAAATRWGAHRIVAEANQGGELVRAVLKQAQAEAGGEGAPVRLLHASRGKAERAGPVAALYEQGRVTHCGDFAALEEELLALGAAEAGGSDDRADALVWAVTELLIAPRREGPRITVL